MELKGSYLYYVQYLMAKAEELGNKKMPIEMCLSIEKKKGTKKASAALERKYNVKTLQDWKDIDSIFVRIPAIYLRRVMEEGYVQRYEEMGRKLEVMAH